MKRMVKRALFFENSELIFGDVHENETEQEAAYQREMLRRIDDQEQGKSKTYTFDEVLSNARKSLAKHQKSA